MQTTIVRTSTKALHLPARENAQHFQPSDGFIVSGSREAMFTERNRSTG